MCVCRLEEASVRYESRESRLEDLELIAELRQRLEEQDALLKRMAVSYNFVASFPSNTVELLIYHC